MPKKARVTPVKQLTARQLSRWQIEHRRQQIIFIIGSAIIIAIITLLGYGYFSYQLAPGWQTAIRVNSTTFNTQYYVNYLLATTGNLPKDAESINSISKMIIEDIQNNELIKQTAPSLNISVSEEEENQYIRDFLIKPDEKDKINEDEIQKRMQMFVTNLPVSLSFFNELVSYNIYRNKLQENLENQIPTEAEQIKLSSILFDTDVEATEVQTKLKGGGDFTALAKEYSKDEKTKDNGGDMGWVPRGVYTDLDDTAFNLVPGTYSEPVITSQGYFILFVTDKQKDRPISEENLQTLKSRVLSNWLTEARQNNHLENSLVDDVTGRLYPKILSWIVRHLKP